MTEKPVDQPARIAGDLRVEHQPGQHRFAVEVEGELAVLEYRKAGKTLILVHTEVPEALAGRGIGGALARAAFEHVREQGLRAALLCPFVKAWIERHPEYRPLLRRGGKG